jgi:4-carboxymuconolactone decarboxylase
MPRIELITDKSQMSPERHAEYDVIAGVLHRVGGPFGVLLHSPGLAEKVCLAGAQVRLKSELTLAEREIALLSVARDKDAAYEWSVHVKIAREAGVGEATLTAIRDAGDTSGLPVDDRDIIHYTRELLETNRVSDATFEALRGRHGSRWVVELTGTIGQYQYIAAINNAFEILPPPGSEQLPIPAPGKK